MEMNKRSLRQIALVVEEIVDRKLDEKLDAKLDARFAEFEKKMDKKLDAKLDAKFEERLKPINEKLDGLQQALIVTMTDVGELKINVASLQGKMDAMYDYFNERFDELYWENTKILKQIPQIYTVLHQHDQRLSTLEAKQKE